MATRSVLICRAHSVEPYGWRELARCPMGWCWIIKTVSVENDGGAQGTLVTVRLSSTNFYIDGIADVLDNGMVRHAQTWIIANEDDAIWWNNPSASLNVWVSGTILPMAPNPPSVPAPGKLPDWYPSVTTTPVVPVIGTSANVGTSAKLE